MDVSEKGRWWVFPTCVGVFPATTHPISSQWRLPHVCGGVSHGPRSAHLRAASSPRVWGCFCPRVPRRAAQNVFPTCVGVFPVNLTGTGIGGGLPHVCGGVSQHIKKAGLMPTSSPRVWGCFRWLRRKSIRWRVFATCVGVFLLPRVCPAPSIRLPHVRGDISVALGCLYSHRTGKGSRSLPALHG